MTLEKGSVGQIGNGTHTTVVYAIAITLVVLLFGIFCALVVLYLFRRREKRRGRNTKDLLSRKSRLDDEEGSSEEEEVEEQNYTVDL